MRPAERQRAPTTTKKIPTYVATRHWRCWQLECYIMSCYACTACSVSSKGSGKTNDLAIRQGQSGKSETKSGGKRSGKVNWITEAIVRHKEAVVHAIPNGKYDTGRFHHGCAFPTLTGEACNSHLRGGTRKVGKQERNRRKNEGERAGKKT